MIDSISLQKAIEELDDMNEDELVERYAPTEQKEHGRLIDADRLLQVTFTVDEEEWTTPEIRAILENAPQVEPKRPLGEWIVGTTKDFLFPDQYTNVYQCDQCGAIEWRNTNYCPSCGAEMKSCDDE